MTSDQCIDRSVFLDSIINMFLLPPKSLIKSMLGFGYIKHLVGSFILDKSYAFLPWMYLDMFCLFSELIDHVVYNRTL